MIASHGACHIGSIPLAHPQQLVGSNKSLLHWTLLLARYYLEVLVALLDCRACVLVYSSRAMMRPVGVPYITSAHIRPSQSHGARLVVASHY
jgi:hypothetical protein